MTKSLSSATHDHDALTQQFLTPTTYSPPNDAYKLSTTEWTSDNVLPAISCGKTQPICEHVPVMLDVPLAHEHV
jgi:uncharacterized protein YbaR (Trm112 family)